MTRIDLHQALKDKFARQMKRGGYGTMSGKEARRWANLYGVAFADITAATKRFGVLVDDPYAERITDYRKGDKSPHGACVSTMTGEVFCEANVGEAEEVLLWPNVKNLPEGLASNGVRFSTGGNGIHLKEVFDDPEELSSTEM